MHKIILSLFVGTTLSISSLATAQWVAKQDVPRTRAEQNAIAVDGKIYVLSGLNENQSTGPAQIDLYDPVNDAWTANIGSMSRNKNHSGVVVYQDRYIIMVGGKTGGQTTGVRWVDRYDTVTNSWDQLPDLPAIVWAAPAVVVGNKLHIFSGAVSNAASETHHFQLDLDNVASGWVTKADVPTAVVHAGAALLNNKVYLIAGESRHGHPTNGQYDLVQVYTPATDTWSAGPDIPVARNHIENSVFVHDGKIWSVSGVDSSNNPRGQVEVLTFNGSAWADEGMDVPNKMVGASAVAVNGTIFVMGGWLNTWTPANLTKTTLAYELENAVVKPNTPPDFLVE